jgi:membrane protein YdbS with pleckstrin-like domain
VYEPLKGALLRLLKVPSGPPDPPPGGQGQVRVFRASRKFLLLRLIVVGFHVVALLLFDGAALVATAFAQPLAATVVLLLLLFIVVYGVLAYFCARLEYELRYYIVTDRALRIRAGVVHLTEVTLTFANIQAVNITQNFVQRWLGISDLTVQTAGGGPASAHAGQGMSLMAHRGVLRGIENPEELRDEIMALVRRYQDAGLGDPEDARRAAGASAEALRLERLREIRDALRAMRP